ncbi:leucine-rich repeat-containing protein 15-like [Coccinella septempunctata]|uniref:leucine-rich repeat-containing protein 15-like n=1 Tax=Coccinella septempunctata TaxID=41139 RepID=UPI001D065343|nr:leucine-rich repeat-containing protein 15-like [Coccinella septempunctata]XP_044752108.1 leucine-rich repeat-containing protein 15-like [Coccinella septempunctata]
MKLRHLLLISVLWKLGSGCMNNCTCSTDNKGRNAMICKEGGIVGPLTLEGMDLDTEVLIITAPEYDMNVLTMVPAFGDFKQLEEVHIIRSNIPQLGEHFFFYLKNLSVLNLSQNNITQVINKNFLGLEKLKELIMDDNRINSLPSGTFSSLKELKVLSIQRNRINELVHSVFQEVKKLMVLKLSGNPVRTLPVEAFRDVQELRTLECRGCALSDMNKQIYPLLPHLNHLDLGENDITCLEKDDFQNLQSLRHLKLDGNKLKHIGENVFSHLTELKKLNLARNEIKSISLSAFDNLDNLTELDLSYNRINALKPHLFDSIRENLLVLSLSGNPLDLTLMKNLFKDSKLRDLRLRQCGLFDITDDIFPTTLISLDLAENYLSGLSGKVIPDGLYYLDISKNMFRGISNDDLLDKIEFINVTLLDRNPWSCDLCFIVPLMNRVNRSSAFRNIVCSQPYVVEGKRLESLDRNKLTWCSSTSYPSGDANFFSINEKSSIGIVAASMSVFLLFLILVVIAGMLCYSKRHAAKYYTHEDKLTVENDFAPDNHSPLFCDDRELSFKFPLDNNVNEKRVSIATIDEMKKEHKITN